MLNSAKLIQFCPNFQKEKKRKKNRLAQDLAQKLTQIIKISGQSNAGSHVRALCQPRGPAAVFGMPQPNPENLPPSTESGDHCLRSSNTHTAFKSMSNMQPNFPKWIVITVIHAYSSSPVVGGFRCERHCIIRSVGLRFENWSHGFLAYQLLCEGPVLG